MIKRKTRTEAIQDWRAKKQGPRRAPTESDKYFFYELRKKSLQRQNLSPEDYEAGIRKIVEDLGI